MKIKIYGISCHECHLFLLKKSKCPDFYLWRYGSIYMCTLISVVKCTMKEWKLSFGCISILFFGNLLVSIKPESQPYIGN